MIPENSHNFKGETVVVALSGGVDSSVAALRLRSAGARVIAVFMKNWEDDDDAADCHDRQDLITAAAAAERLGIDFEVVNFAEDYRRLVFTPFLQTLRQGRTPNPDVLCNSEIKFSAFHDYAKKHAAAAVATGHYARAGCADGQWRLYKSEDSAKDQTYFLHRLTPAQISRTVFPIGGMLKSDVRRLARESGLENWARKDSTGICFIGERRFRSFLSRYLPDSPGDMVDDSGRVIGQHVGLPFYTIGQRQGLEIGGAGEAWYVAGKRPQDNTLLVVQGKDHPLLFRREVKIEETHWIAGQPPPLHWVYAARIRHRQTPASCTLVEAEDGRANIVFAAPQRAVTPGQYAVLYDGNICLGGGVISDSIISRDAYLRLQGER